MNVQGYFGNSYQKQVLTVTEAVTKDLTDTDSRGAAEEAMEVARKTACKLGELIEMLAESHRLTPEEVRSLTNAAEVL